MSKSVLQIRTAYDGLDEEFSIASGITCTLEEGKTVQSEAQNADLNYLLRNLRGMDGIPVVGDPDTAFYGDVSEIGDYHECMCVIAKATEAFMSQPAHIRDKFENDAGKFIEFVSNDANKDEAIKLGLIEAPPAPVPPTGG